MSYKDKQKKRQYQHKWQQEHPEQYKESSRRCHLKTRYGMSLEEYKQRMKKQNGVCAICKEPETHIVNGKVRLLSVDHDHTTGKIRGLLCNRCNLMVADFEANQLKKIKNYLGKYV